MEKVFTNEEHAQWLRKQAELKRPYWYGVYHLPCTEKLLEKKRKQYPAHYGDNRMETYRSHIAAGQVAGDCVNGAIKGAVWSELDRREPIYRSHDCPDKSADGMFAYCKEQGMEWGSMESMPDEPGVAVRMAGHVGVYVGNGEVVEWRGFRYGCVITKLKERKWLHWYRLPWTEYKKSGQTGAAAQGVLGQRLLKRGCTGEDVKMLQELLMMLGYELPEWGADGEYGMETGAAVRAFQVLNGLLIDGEYGEQTHRVMTGLLAEREEAEEEADAAQAEKAVLVTGGAVYIRSGAGQEHDILAVVRKGMRLEWAATAANGWHAVKSGGLCGWIGPKYTEVTAA